MDINDMKSFKVPTDLSEKNKSELIECIQILTNKNRNTGNRQVVNLLIVENSWTTKSVQNHN